MRKTLLILISVTLLLAGQVTAIDLNSSRALQYYGAANTDGNLDFQVGTDGSVDVYGGLDMSGNSITGINGLNNCTADQALLGDGSCGSTGGTQNLKQVLAAGNTANQTIEFSNGIEIGDSSTSVGSNTDAVAVGKGAEASGRSALAIGHYASVVGPYSSLSGRYALAFGRNASTSEWYALAFGPFAVASRVGASAFGYAASASGDYASAVGYAANASGNSALAFGPGTDASAGAVAIGHKANAPNSDEATFGNLNGDELDVNVTGDLTVHGSGGLDMNGNKIASSTGSFEVENANTTQSFQIPVGEDAY